MDTALSRMVAGLEEDQQKTALILLLVCLFVGCLVVCLFVACLLIVCRLLVGWLVGWLVRSFVGLLAVSPTQELRVRKALWQPNDAAPAPAQAVGVPET